MRLDEAAALIHPVTPAKMALVLLGGFVAGMILTPAVCVGWVVGGLAIEAWGWFASRAQARARRVGWRTRRQFIASYVAINLWWALLGLLFWASGSMEGQARSAGGNHPPDGAGGDLKGRVGAPAGRA